MAHIGKSEVFINVLINLLMDNKKCKTDQDYIGYIFSSSILLYLFFFFVSGNNFCIGGEVTLVLFTFLNFQNLHRRIVHVQTEKILF